jgi:threonyl-tRNA synthetase
MPKDLKALRHSTEHVLTQAMLNLYGEKITMAMGPATDDGFYFDFSTSGRFKISEKDFPQIEKEMDKIIAADLPFKRQEISLKKAREMFKNNQYKQEWLDEIEAKGQKAVVYWTGDQFVDLCSGPHLKSAGEIKAFKLLSVAGAYWRGSEKNKMLSRIYGTAFFSQKELKQYLRQLAEAKKHDHRQLGKKLELFALNDQVGPGLVLWLPKGNIIKEELENWAKQVEKDWGYQRVTTPHITKAGLYYTSGHLPYYQKDMYPPMTLDDDQQYFLKPMNCPHHHMIYASKPRSYKELPLRLAEFGTCYRYESSGELFGLMRVRGFTQNDAHIYCTPDQAVNEFVQVMKLHQHFYKTLGITQYHLELALRDPKNKTKYHGDSKMWQSAEKLMRQAVSQVKISMVEEKGNAAFYGPKIDFIIHSSVGREFAISTNQIDLFMGQRFQLKYIDKDGQEKTPVIIHRAPLGAHERFIAFLIEHYAGAFPLWLSPVQVVIIPISDKQNLYAKKVAEKLKAEKIRVELDSRSDSMQARIRDAELQKTPYILIIGAKEAQAKQVAVRQRSQGDLGPTSLTNFIRRLKQEIEEKTLT